MPYTRQFTNTNVDAIRVRLSVPALSKTNTSNGDISGHIVAYAIEVSTDNGPFVAKITSSFNGKCTSKYERDHRIELPRATDNWVVRVVRKTANQNSAAYQDITSVESMTEIIDAKLRYPNSALVGVVVDAEQFPNIPSRAYHIRGKIIKVPTNYDPENRTYTGTWDGTFKMAWTNNPAWVYYDLCTNERYGLGHIVTPQMVNRYNLCVLRSIAINLFQTALVEWSLALRVTCSCKSVKTPTRFCKTLRQSFAVLLIGATAKSWQSATCLMIRCTRTTPPTLSKVSSYTKVLHARPAIT
ncbi:tail protein [Xanthomonas phage JGB6]|nr:tail protein [Xanthomonas phage JGB6]